MRSGSWGPVAPVTGIECAGTVEYDPRGRLAAGTTVVGLLGGLGRTRNGSYGERWRRRSACGPGRALAGRRCVIRRGGKAQPAMACIPVAAISPGTWIQPAGQAQFCPFASACAF
ncbi:MAG: hypothetical protein ABJB47_21560 [Actinomycetota bacterium]